MPYTIREFEKYIEDAGYYMLPSSNPLSRVEPEASRVQTHLLAGTRNKLLCVPKEETLALYSKYLLLKAPRPCLVERTKNREFPLFFDVDFKLLKFCVEIEQEDPTSDKEYAVAYTFGPEGAREWFLRQQRILLRITEEVVQETTDLPLVQVHFSIRTCYKFHIYVPEIVVNEAIAGHMCKEIVHRWTLHEEYQACPQNPYDIVDKSVYSTGLRMLGCDKGNLAGANAKKRDDKMKEDTKLHQLLFGDTEEYKLTYPSVVGYDVLNLEVLKRFSVLLMDDREINAKIPNTWASFNTALERRQMGPLQAERQSGGAGEAERAVLTEEAEDFLLNAVRPFVNRAEIKSRRVLHGPSGTHCLVLAPQPCHFKGSAHSRTARDQDTMWILATKHRAELRCYACPDKPKKLLSDYNPPTLKMHLALSFPCQATVANIVYDFVESSMAASAVGRNTLVFYKYDYDCNIWREDHFYLHELITNTDEQLWTTFWNMNMTSEAEEKARKKLLVQLGTASFRNGVMDMIGRKLIRKWFIELGNKYFDDQLNQNRHLCIFSNGTWDWKKDEFRQGSPTDCSLLSTQLPYIPWNQISPEIQEMTTTYVSNFQPVEEESNYIVQNVAFCLDPSDKKEAVFVFSGRGANGKTAYMNLISRALGDYSGIAAQSMFTQQPPDSQKPREDIMSARNCRVLCVSELTGTLVLGTMKVLSGHDRFTARHNHQSQIKFYLHFTIFILTNETPKITAGAGDHGTWRRLIFAVFRVTFRSSLQEITDPMTERVGMTPAQFHAVQDKIAVGFLSLLVEYKRSPHIYPLPAAYAAEQKAQENKNSIYIRFLNDAVNFPLVNPETQLREFVGSPCSMMTLFLGFTEWMKMRRSSMNSIDFDVFNDQIRVLMQLRQVYPYLDAQSQEMVYEVTVKDAYGGTRRGI